MLWCDMCQAQIFARGRKADELLRAGLVAGAPQIAPAPSPPAAPASSPPAGNAPKKPFDFMDF